MGRPVTVKRKIAEKVGQQFDKDGIGLLGRIGSFGAVITLALYVAAVMFEAWLETEHFGHPGLTDVGLQDVASAKFGIRGYCLGTEMHGFLITAQELEPSSVQQTKTTADVCFMYKEEVQYEAMGEQVYQTDGCSRLNTGGLAGANPCKKRNSVVILMIIAISTAMIGDIYSEKPLLNGLMLLLSSGFSGGTIALWLSLAQHFEEVAQAATADPGLAPSLAESRFRIGIGFIFLCAGCGCAFIFGIVAALDRCVCASEIRITRMKDQGWFMCHDDGVGYSGRLGSLLSVCAWIALMAALATNSWIETDKLGRPGCFCSSPEYTNRSNGCPGKASFGLWKYCMHPLVPAYGNKPYPVCFDYSEIITTPNQSPETVSTNNCTGITANGIERFSEWNFGRNRMVTFWGVVGSIVAIMVGDVYSEKLMLCCIMNLIGTGCGVFVTIIWISFFQSLAMDTDGRMTLGMSGTMLILGFMGSLLTAMLYGKDWLCNVVHIIAVVDHKGNVIHEEAFNSADEEKRRGIASEGDETESTDGIDNTDDPEQDNYSKEGEKEKRKKKKRQEKRRKSKSKSSSDDDSD